MSIHLMMENSSLHSTPNETQFSAWVSSVLSVERPDAELCIQIVDNDEMRYLNSTFRGKDKPTNVLSFPVELPKEIPLNLIGDIAICAPIIEQEAAEQNKPLDAHYAHMSIHGALHLCGYDHENENDAAVMEQKEIDALKKLGYANPYLQSKI